MHVVSDEVGLLRVSANAAPSAQASNEGRARLYTTQPLLLFTFDTRFLPAPTLPHHAPRARNYPLAAVISLQHPSTSHSGPVGRPAGPPAVVVGRRRVSDASPSNPLQPALQLRASSRPPSGPNSLLRTHRIRLVHSSLRILVARLALERRCSPFAAAPSAPRLSHAPRSRQLALCAPEIRSNWVESPSQETLWGISLP